MENFKFIARIRNPINSTSQSCINFSPQRENSENSFVSKSPSTRRIILQQRIENFIGKNSELARIKTIDNNNDYSIFTTVNQSNVVAVSSRPLSGRFIKDNFFNKNDVIKLSNKLNIRLFDFDKVYNDQNDLEQIYSENLKENVRGLFRGTSITCMLLGPSNSGKSFVCRGNKDEKGLIENVVKEIFSTVDKENKNFSVYVSISNLFFEKMNDLISQNFLNDVKVENLVEREMEVKSEIFELINEAIKKRKILEERIKIQDFLKKSHFLITIKIKLDNNYFSQIDFIELASSQYILGENEEIASNENYYKILSDTILNYNKDELNLTNKLGLYLRKMSSKNRKMIFINSIIPNDENVNNSLSVLKFTVSIKERLLSNNDRAIKEEKGDKYIYEENNENCIRTEGNEEEEQEFSSREIKENSNLVNKSLRINKSSNDEFGVSNIPNSKRKEDEKINNLERHIFKLDQKSKDLTETLESLRKEKFEGKFIKREENSQVVDKLKSEMAILKSDNIIFREEINRLCEINLHLEAELSKQRNRNYELAADYEKLFQEKLSRDSEVEKLSIELAKLSRKDVELNETTNLRFQMDLKIKELEMENKNLKNEKQKFEIEFKILSDKFSEILKKSEIESRELAFLKTKQNEDLNLFETKLEKMTKEIEFLQRENNSLRSNEEKLRQDLLNSEKQRDTFRDKYQDYKAKNNIMNTKLSEIELEFKTILLEKERENEIKFSLKSEESSRKQEKLDTKQKLIGEMQNRIMQFKSDFLKKRFVNSSNAEKEN